ncbi:MAG TPA: thiamine diphosphokinase [Candidatus Thermoplasmatota archaeon]|nr:thiamine diphosphokinase [Candidatus Thermoplasmatota archaeon]
MASEAVLVFPRASAELVRRHVAPGARVIAVDAGADACLAAGVAPWALVGDMDSVSEATLAACERAGARIERHPAQKRDTDAALALGLARDAERILFVGAGGGRADHALANLHLLASAAAWADARAVDEDAHTWVVTPQRPLTLALPVGTTLSALPFDERVEGVTYEGLAYPLDEATFTAGDPYGVSNVASAPAQRIRVRRGRLFVIRPLP